MARPRWTPQTDEQRRAITAVERAAKRADEADELLWEAVRAAHKVDVPPAHLAEKAGRARSTVYRHLPEQPEG
ncbi:hypothetical protein [Micromonospora sp. NPDC023633]|uniref:hypothetical protein n=1 Tax=Micromonospora sp. NPDC023633 TaxID=3154320 RepID=UPI0033E3D649